MATRIKRHGDELVGSRVKVLWPKDKSFCEGVISSHGHSRKNLVIHADGLEKVLKFKADHMNVHKDGFADKGRETSISPNVSSNEHSDVKDYGDALVGCTVKVWQHENKTWSEGTVMQYYFSLKKHLVSYAAGGSELLNLYYEPEEPARSNSQDQAHNLNRSVKQEQPSEKTHINQERKRSNPAPSSDACPSQESTEVRQTHMSKKFKGQSCNPVIAGKSSFIKCNSNSEDDKEQEQKVIDPEILTSQYADASSDVHGYKVKETAAPILEAIFAKYGDIAKDCLFKSPSVRASLLEVVCNIVLKLQNYYTDTILLDLETIQNEVSDVKAAKIDVSWLTQYLAKFQEVSGFHEENLLLKNSKKNVGLVIGEASESLQERRRELSLAEKRVKEVERYVDVMKLVSRKIDKEILASENEEYFWRRRLGGLLEPDESYDMYL